MSRISDAKDFAIEAHKGQMYGKELYMTHIYAVVETARGFLELITDERMVEDLIIACFLHDTVEDTPATVEDIEARFGSRVAALVDAVTCRPARSRKEKFAEAYPRIRATEGAGLVKLADRVANVRSCYATQSPLIFMYGKEYLTFRAELRDPADELAKPMWAELDRLLGWREHA